MIIASDDLWECAQLSDRPGLFADNRALGDNLDMQAVQQLMNTFHSLTQCSRIMEFCVQFANLITMLNGTFLAWKL